MLTACNGSTLTNSGTRITPLGPFYIYHLFNRMQRHYETTCFKAFRLNTNTPVQSAPQPPGSLKRTPAQGLKPALCSPKA